MSLNSVQMMPACISVIRNVGSGGECTADCISLRLSYQIHLPDVKIHQMLKVQNRCFNFGNSSSYH